jgi:hypothetical protein
VEVETKDGRAVSGRMVENTETRLRLLAAGPKEEVIARSDIVVENGKPRIHVSELSVMPEGLEQMPDPEFRSMIWFLLNPPEDNRPWTPALRKELIGDEAPSRRSAQTAPPLDLESVALWNPDWRVLCPPFEGAPAKLPEYAGRRNVLMTHPADRERGAALERIIELPAGAKGTLSFAVAAHEQGDWQLRVLAEGKVIHRQIVAHAGPTWKQVELDLSPYAGRPVALRLENNANDWNWEFAYWSDLQIRTSGQTAQLQGKP